MARKSGFVSGKSTYSKTPSSLLGFSTNPARQKGYAEQGGKSFRVRVETGAGDVFKDEVMGMNAQHALEKANRNWPGAKIRVTNIVKGITGNLLSPAGLAEDIAAGIATNAKIQAFKRDVASQDKPSRGGLKKPKTKA